MSDCGDQLTLRPELPAVSQAIQWLENIAVRDGWPARITFGLTLCLDEALTNAISYAFEPPVTEPALRVTYGKEADRIVVGLHDNGRAYDPTADEPPALATCLDEARIGGHGLRLMRHYLDDFTYCRTAGWNCLTLVMRLSGSEPGL